MPTPVPHLADFLQTQRARLGLTQAALARRAGCTRQYIALLERGERANPSAAVALGLSRALGLGGEKKRDFLALCGHPVGEAAPRETGEVDEVAAHLLAQIPAPAILHDGTWHMRRLNAPAAATLAALGFEAREGVSLLSLAFDPRHRAHFPGWEPWARYLLAQFKRDSLPLSRTHAHAALLRELRALPDFTRLWRSVTPADDATPLMSIRYAAPGGPVLTFTLVRMQFVGTPELWGIVFLPGEGDRIHAAPEHPNSMRAGPAFTSTSVSAGTVKHDSLPAICGHRSGPRSRACYPPDGSGPDRPRSAIK